MLADVGGAGVRGDGSLAGTMAVSVAGGVGRAVALLLGLLLLELLAGTGTAALRVVSVVQSRRVLWGWRGGWTYGTLEWLLILRL